MTVTYGKFASVPIGAGLAARDGGLTLTTNVDNRSLSVAARSDVSVTNGTSGAGFAFWGDAPLVAAIGIIQTGGSLSAALGSAPESIGWRVDLGTVTQGNTTLRSGLPILSKGSIAGIRISISAGTVELYANSTLIATINVPLSGFNWHFAAALSATVSGQLSCAVNAGQWQAISAAEQAGWLLAKTPMSPLYAADLEFISAPTDATPHVRYEGVLDIENLAIAQSVAFWPWRDTQVSGGNNAAAIRCFDPQGQLDALLSSTAADVPALVANVSGTSRDAAAILSRFRLDRVEVESEQVKVIYLSDAEEGLDLPVARGVFLPNVPALAWKPQPAIIGAVANVPGMPCVADGSSQFIADGKVYATSVRDRGDLMEPGTCTLDASGQQLLFTSPPRGPVTMDASSVANDTPATLVQAMKDLMQRANSGAWLQADAQAIDTLTGYGVGYYSADATNVGKAIDIVLASFTAARYRDAAGNLRIARLIDPDSILDANLAFDADDFIDEVISAPDKASGLTRTMNYRPNAKVLAASDLVTDYVDVPQGLRDKLTATHQGRVYSPRALPRGYVAASAADPMNSVFWSESAASAELDRVLALYSVQRNFYTFSIRWTSATPPYPGMVGRISYRGSNGATQQRKVFISAVVWQPAKGIAELIGWGA